MLELLEKNAKNAKKKMLEKCQKMLEKMLDLAHFQSKTRGNFWPIFGNIQSKSYLNFWPILAKKKKKKKARFGRVKLEATFGPFL